MIRLGLDNCQMCLNMTFLFFVLDRERSQQFIGSENGLRLYWVHAIIWTNKVLQFTDAYIRRRPALVIFIRIFLTENDVNILIWSSLKVVPGCSANNLPTLVEIMAWRRSGDKPLSKRVINLIIDTYVHHWVNVVWSASSNYLNQFWVIAHYTPRNKSPWKWKLNQDISSSSPSAAYMRQRIGWALLHIMACRLLGAKPLPNQSWLIVNWTLRNKLQWN